MAMTNAEKQKQYRARKQRGGDIAARGKSGVSFKNKARFDVGEFIAIDGEGESRGRTEKFKLGKGKTYHAKEHFYTLLAASTGEQIFEGGNRLSSFGCIDFLCELAINYPRAIFVIFAGGYDINHMLMWGFDRDTLKQIARGETVSCENDGVKYEIEYRARKSLTLRRGLEFYTDKKGDLKKKWESKVVLWDVWGFFQDSFVGVIKKWLGENYKHYELIKDMKTRRGDFANVAQDKINAYNAAELETLVEVMDKVRDAIGGLGLKCNRWDGAGAVAASILREHKIREFMSEPPPEIIDAARTAYAGGRIEVCKIGVHKGAVYDYDINSAYPSVMAHLPCLLHGDWVHNSGSNPPSGFTLVHCRFEFPAGAPFYPLFYRTDKMQISFPQTGEGWYWFPEYEQAAALYGTVEVLEYYTWKPACNHKPFHWIKNYYKIRQQWIKNPTADWHRGAEKIIKLGTNSLYGKTAQQIGGRNGDAPPYHNLCWAGYITSATRARLFEAANLKPDKIIGFATDGIFSIESLPIEISRTKKMGAWELKEPIPEGMTIAMAGVYWWHDAKDKFTHFSRGFDKDSMKTPHKIIDAWKAGDSVIDIPMHRLIGMGSACTSDTLFAMRGRFTEGMRTLRLDGHSHKRQGANVKKSKPHLKLVDLKPSLNLEYDMGLQGCSHPYPLAWMDEIDDDYLNELELIRENADTENI